MKMLPMVFALAWLPFLSSAKGEDWPQWRGPNRDDISTERNLLASWPAGGPPLAWISRDAGLGYSGPAVVGDRIYLLGLRKNTCHLIALDANTGREVWAADVGERYENRWGDGPRATPTVDGDYVYAMSGLGDLVGARRQDGHVIWRVAMDDLGGKIPMWGYCESVLVDGNKVICSPGGNRGAMVALDKMSGEILWQSDEITSEAHYSSPVLMTLGDKRMYVQLFSDQLVGVDADTGRLLWQTDWEGKIAVIPTPIVDGNSVYITSGYGTGCKRVDLALADDGETIDVTEVYANKVMKNHHGGVVLHDGNLFGYSDSVGWICQSWRTGDEVWSERSALGKGAIAFADGKLYCLEEDSGSVVLVNATTEGWTEQGRFTLAPQTTHRKPAGRIWTHPVISNGRLYLRDQELFYCFNVGTGDLGSR